MVALCAFDYVSRQGVPVRQTPSLSCASHSQLNLQELLFEDSSDQHVRQKKFWQAKRSVRAPHAPRGVRRAFPPSAGGDAV